MFSQLIGPYQAPHGFLSQPKVTLPMCHLCYFFSYNQVPHVMLNDALWVRELKRDIHAVMREYCIVEQEYCIVNQDIAVRS